MMNKVAAVPCQSYETQEVQNALSALLTPIGGLDWVTPGMKIAIKANLVSLMKPDAAATTHPSVLCELTKMLVERGAEVTVGDSPGGIYNAAYLSRIYSVTGVKAITDHGGKLNQNFSEHNTSYPDGMVLRNFTYTSYLNDADAIINLSKLKTHGMMGMSAAVKNMFGVIPGTTKPEYHFRFPEHRDFAKMLIDINEYFADKIKLCICDAVVGMEGNGPTQGTPRRIGALLACATPYEIDLVAAKLIGLSSEDVPTLQIAAELGKTPESAEKLEVIGEYLHLCVKDFKNIHVRRSLEFEGAGKFASMFLKGALRSRPKPDKHLCIGCKKCYELCPPKAIAMVNGIPRIDTKVCITCFCCQEFCPVGAMKVHRPLIAKIANKI